MMKKQRFLLRRFLALSMAVCCLSTAALAAQPTEAAHPLEQVLSPLQQRVQQNLIAQQHSESAPLQGPSAQQLSAVRQVAASAASSQATLTYTPSYSRSVSYNRGASVPALALANSTYLGEYKLTFYCPCSKCCGAYANGVTASGKRATEGRTIAVDPRKIPLGSKVHIEGLGDFIAEDVGGAIKGNKIDVYVDSHAKAYQIGVVSSTSVYLMK